MFYDPHACSVFGASVMSSPVRPEGAIRRYVHKSTSCFGGAYCFVEAIMWGISYPGEVGSMWAVGECVNG